MSFISPGRKSGVVLGQKNKSLQGQHACDDLSTIGFAVNVAAPSTRQPEIQRHHGLHLNRFTLLHTGLESPLLHRGHGGIG